MSSQASSAGGQEAKVREAMIKTGDMDVMIAIRGNFFYTRSVPCELWFMDKAKPEVMRDKVLMIDARHIYRKVTRKIYDFTPEQQQNLASIVWLYRGQNDRFLKLVEGYLENAFTQMQSCDFIGLIDAMGSVANAHDDVELTELSDTLQSDIAGLNEMAKAAKLNHWNGHNRDNVTMKAAATVLAPIAEQAKSLAKSIDHYFKMSVRAHDSEAIGGAKPVESKKLLLTLDAARHEVIEHLRQARYFHGQAEWLQDRFPDAALCDVEGLVKLVDRAEIKSKDWSLTPGRYVGVVSEAEDEDFDFEASLRDLHIEIDGLNVEAVELASAIKKNIEALIV